MALDWLKRGDDARANVAREDAKAAERDKGRVYRFWLPPGGDSQITFLDGGLRNGTLDYLLYYEHQVAIGGDYRNWFVCLQEDCPLCEQGQRNYMASPFTVIDHREYTDSKGVQQKDQVRLFIAKRTTLKLLELLSSKRNGLAGCTFDVHRTEGDKVASVGDHYEFVEKRSLQAIRTAYGVKGPLNYGEVLPKRTEAELRKLGFGAAVVGVNEEPLEEPLDDDIPF